MSRVTVELDGLPELIRALRNNAGLADVLRDAFGYIGNDAKDQSKFAAPVNYGKLRASIVYEVDPSPLPTSVRIGTIGSQKPKYAAYMEYGTGLVHDHPSWPRRRHIPFEGRNPANGPVAGLADWARAKGRGSRPMIATAAAVAYAIMRRGGLEPRRYLRGPFERNQARYVRELRQAIGRLSLG